MHSETVDTIELSMNQKFEIERMNRIIDNVDNITELKKVTKQLMEAWQLQRSAALWAMRLSLPTINTNAVPDCSP